MIAKVGFAAIMYEVIISIVMALPVQVKGKIIATVLAPLLASFFPSVACQLVPNFCMYVRAKESNFVFGKFKQALPLQAGNSFIIL